MNRISALSVICIFAVVGLGCATSQITTDVALQKEIGEEELIYVMQAQDGAYGDRIYKGSGLSVSRIVHRTLREIQPLAQLVDNSNEPEAINTAKEKGASYLLVPELVHWEDRATAWSGYRDKVEIQLRLLSLEPVEVISSQSYYTTNNSITFLSTKPEDLLDERFEQFIYQFLGKKAPGKSQ